MQNYRLFDSNLVIIVLKKRGLGDGFVVVFPLLVVVQVKQSSIVICILFQGERGMLKIRGAESAISFLEKGIIKNAIMAAHHPDAKSIERPKALMGSSISTRS